MLQNIVEMPNQSAILMIVPRLPGSCTLSSARQSSRSHILMSRVWVGILNIPITCCGCCKKLIFFSSSSVTVTSCGLALLLLALYHSSVAIRRSGLYISDKSPTTLGPSATKTPSFCLFFLSSSERIYLMRFFEIMVLTDLLLYGVCV